MYIPKHCPECGEKRSGFVETAPNHIGCQKCGMEFEIKVTLDVDDTTATTSNDIIKSCNNCGTKDRSGCSWHTAEDCGGDYTMWSPK